VNFKKALILTGAVVSSFAAYAQCTSFTKKKCMPELLPYIHNGQMNTVNLAPGESASTKASFYSGQDYRILVCPHKALENVYFEVRTSDDELVYSSKGSKKEDWNFNVASTQELSINVFVPAAESPSGMPQAGCVAVLIGFKE
jgi:hypothetical protein